MHVSSFLFSPPRCVSHHLWRSHMESPPGEPTWRAHMESPCGSFSPIFQKVRDDNLSMSAHIKNAPPSAYSPPAWRLQSSCSARRSARSRLCVCGRGTILAICATHGGTSHGTGRQWTPRAVSLHPRARQGLAGAACPVGGGGQERNGKAHLRRLARALDSR